MSAPTINITSVLVDDQAKALAFYTDVLGFVKKTDIDLGAFRWLTVVSPDHPDGVELLLEPDQHPAASAFKKALVADSMAFTSFAVADLEQTHAELVAKGVTFIQPPTPSGPVLVAVLDDTCGNLIALTGPAPASAPDSDSPESDSASAGS